MANDFTDLEKKENERRMAMGLSPLPASTWSPKRFEPVTDSDIEAYVERVREVAKKLYPRDPWRQEKHVAEARRLSEQSRVANPDVKVKRRKTEPRRDKPETERYTETLRKGTESRYASKEDLERDLETVREEIKSTKSPKKKPKAEESDSQLVVNDSGVISRVPISEASKEGTAPELRGERVSSREALSPLGSKVFKSMFPTLGKIVESIESFEKNERKEAAEEKPRLDRELASNEMIAVSMESLVGKSEVTVQLLDQLLDEIRALRSAGGLQRETRSLPDLIDDIPGGGRRRDRTGRSPRTGRVPNIGAPRPPGVTSASNMSRLASAARATLGAVTSAPVVAGAVAAGSLGVMGAAIHRTMSMSPEEREANRQRAESQAAAGREEFEGRRDAAPRAAAQAFYGQLPQGLKLEDVVDSLDSPEEGETSEQKANRERMARELASGNGRPTQEMIEYAARRRPAAAASPPPAPTSAASTSAGAPSSVQSQLIGHGDVSFPALAPSSTGYVPPTGAQRRESEQKDLQDYQEGRVSRDHMFTRRRLQLEADMKYVAEALSLNMSDIGSVLMAPNGDLAGVVMKNGERRMLPGRDPESFRRAREEQSRQVTQQAQAEVSSPPAIVPSEARQERAVAAVTSGAGGPAVQEQRDRGDFNEELRNLVRSNALTRAQANDISRRVLLGPPSGITIEQAREEIDRVTGSQTSSQTGEESGASRVETPPATPSLAPSTATSQDPATQTSGQESQQQDSTRVQELTDSQKEMMVRIHPRMDSNDPDMVRLFLRYERELRSSHRRAAEESLRSRVDDLLMRKAAVRAGLAPDLSSTIPMSLSARTENHVVTSVTVGNRTVDLYERGLLTDEERSRVDTIREFRRGMSGDRDGEVSNLTPQPSAQPQPVTQHSVTSGRSLMDLDSMLASQQPSTRSGASSSPSDFESPTSNYINRVSNVAQRSGELRKDEAIPTRGPRKDESDETLVSEEVSTQEALAEQYTKDPALFSNRDLVMRAKSFKFEGDEIEFKQDYSQVQQSPLSGSLQPPGGQSAPSATPSSVAPSSTPSATPQATSTEFSAPETPSEGAQTTQVGGETATAARDLNFAAGIDPRINRDIADKVKQIQSSFGKSLTITSGFRDPQRNARAGGARNSAHTRGNAVDIRFRGNEQDTIKLVEAASAAGIGGIGVYGPGWVHLDTESKRVWGPDFSSRSIPEWAKGALDAHMSGRSATQQQSQAGSGEAISAASMGGEGSSGGGGSDATTVSGGGVGAGSALAGAGDSGGGSSGSASPVPSTPPTGMAVAAASTENAVAERTPVPPTVVQAGDTGSTPGNPSVGAPDYFHSPDDPGPVEPADAAERYARLFNMAA